MPPKRKGTRKTTKCVKYYKVCNKSAYVKGRKVNVYKNKSKPGYFYKKLVNGKASYRKLKASHFKRKTHKKLTHKRKLKKGRKTVRKLTKRSRKALTGVTKKIKKLSSQLSKLKKQKSKMQKKLRFGDGGFGTGGEGSLYQMMGPTLTTGSS
jgi:hypothetical protein